MKKLLVPITAFFLYGCTYTEIYVHEGTEIFRNSGSARHDDIANLLADSELVLYPDFNYFQPGYDEQFVILGIFSMEPGTIQVSSVKFARADTGLLHEKTVDQSVTLRYNENFRGIPNLGMYGNGIRISGDNIYPEFYGAIEIEMTVYYSVNGRSSESSTFKLKRITDVHFILGAV